MAEPGLDAGSVSVGLGAAVDEADFKRYDRLVERAEKHRKVETELGAKVDEQAFDSYFRKLDQAERRSKHRTAFKAALGGDYSARAFNAYFRDLEKARREARRPITAELNARTDDSGIRRFTNAVRNADGGLIGLRTRIPLVKWGLIAAGALSAVGPLAALAAGLSPVLGLVGAIPGLIATAGGALTSGMLGLQGVGDATKAAWDQQAQSAAAGTAAAQQQEGALEAVTAAEERLSDSHRQVGVAQEDLNRTRAEARQRLAELREETRQSALQEDEARLAVRRAREELAKTQRDPESSELDIDEGEAQVRRARANLRQARSDRRQTARELRRAEGGVDPQVIEAERRLAEARRDRKRSARDVARAERDAARAMDDAGGSADQLQEKMAKLSPAGQRFVRFLQSDMFPVVRRLQATAQAGLLPGLEDGIRGAMRNLPVVERGIDRISRAMGGGTRDLGRELGTKEWGRDLDQIFGQSERLIRRSGDASIGWANGLRHVTVSAKPLLDWAGDMNVRLSKMFEHWAQSGRETGRLERFFEKVTDRTELAVEAIWDFGKAIVNIGSVADRVWGGDLLRNINNSAEALREWTESSRGQQQIEEFFERWRRRWEAISREVGRVVGRYRELRREGKATGDAMATALAESFNRVIPIIIRNVGRNSPEIAKAFVTGFLEANVWGKLLLGGWLLKKLGGGALTSAVGGRLGGQIADSVTGSITRRFGGRALESAGGEAAGTMVGGLTSGLRKRAGRVRDTIRRFLLGGRVIGGAAEGGASAIAGEFTGTLASRMRRRAGSIRDVIRRNLLGGRLAGGAAEGAGGALGGAFVGSLAGRVRGRAGQLRDIIRRRLLGGAAVGGAVEGAGAAVGGLFASTVGARIVKEGGARGAIGRAMRIAGRAGAIGMALSLASELEKQLKKNKLFRDFSKNAERNHPTAGAFKRLFGGGGAEGGLVTPRGVVRGYQAGGMVVPAGEDTVIGARFGEFMQSKPAVDREGVGAMRDLNAGRATIARPAGGAGLAGTLESDRKRATGPLRKIGDDLSGLAARGLDAGRRTAKNLVAGLTDAHRNGRRISRRLNREVGRDFDDLRKDATGHTRKLETGASDDFEELRKNSDRSTRRMLRSVDERFDDMRGSSVRSTRRASTSVEREFRGMERQTVRSLRSMARSASDRFGDMAASGKRGGARLHSSVRSSMGSVDRAVWRGLDYVADATSKALKAFDAKPVRLSVPKPKGLATGGRLRRAQGGWLGARGMVSNDVLPIAPGAVAAFGEYDAHGPSGTRAILTRHQAPVAEAALAAGGYPGLDGLPPGRQLPFLEAAMAPFGGLDDLFSSVTRPHYMAKGGRLKRFAKGGSHGPGAMGSGKGFEVLMRVIQSMFGRDVYVFSGSRPGSTTTSGRQSNHSGGNAIDITHEGGEGASQGSPMTGAIGREMDQVHAWLRKYVVPKIGRDFLWRTMTGGNHFNHIHLGANDPWAHNAAAMRKFLSGIPKVKGLDADIPKIKVQGTKGPMRGIAQAAIEMARKGAQGKVDKASEASSALGGLGQGVGAGKGSASRAQMVKWATQALHQTGHGAPPNAIEKILTLARKESNWIVDSINLWDSNAKAGNPSGGLMHVTLDKVGGSKKNLFDPVKNMVASIRYQFSRYGGLITHSPYARGGRRLLGGLRSFAKGGRLGSIKKATSKKVGKATAGIRGTSKLPGFEQQIADLGESYGREERRFSLTEEDLVKEPGEVGFSASVNRGEPYLDRGALAQRTKELRRLIDIRRQIVKLYDRYEKAIRRTVKTYQDAIKRLRRARPKRGRRRKTYNDAISGYQRRIKGWQGKLKEVSGGHFDAVTDLREVGQELSQLEPGARAELGGLASQGADTGSSAGDESGDVQAQLAQATQRAETLAETVRLQRGAFDVFGGPGDIGAGAQYGLRAAANPAGTPEGTGPGLGLRIVNTSSGVAVVDSAGQRVALDQLVPRVTVNAHSLVPADSKSLRTIGEVASSAFGQQGYVPSMRETVGPR